MMTEEDIKRIIDEKLSVERAKGFDPQRVQWLVRSAFEEAWRAAGGDPAQSPHDAEPVGWRAAWMRSTARNILVRNGIISGQDSYR